MLERIPYQLLSERQIAARQMTGPHKSQPGDTTDILPQNNTAATE